MITGKYLEETAAKSSKKVPALLSLDGVYRTTIYNWDAIAAEISPKPLTIEELVEMLSSSCPIPVDLREGHRRIDNEWKLSEGFCTVWGPLDLQKLLDLINNKQKEQS